MNSECRRFLSGEANLFGFLGGFLGGVFSFVSGLFGS